jgi:hypothetical protein
MHFESVALICGGRGRLVFMSAKFLAFVYGPFFRENPNFRKEFDVGKSVHQHKIQIN